MKKVTTDENALYMIGWGLLASVTLGFIIVRLCPQMFEVGKLFCLFHLLTGFYCPGCGGTRAIRMLLKGKMITSLRLHPLVLYIALVGGWFMISHTVEKLSRGKFAIGMKYRDGWLWAALALLLLNFLIKNILLFVGIDALQVK